MLCDDLAAVVCAIDAADLTATAYRTAVRLALRADDDRRTTTHDVRQHAVARLLFVPYHLGWHLAHHADPGVPFRSLPRFHDELRRAGWITDEMTHPSYRVLWRALRAG